MARTFWQDESYDRLVRSEAEFDRIRAYIEENPRDCGSGEAQQDPWSSAENRLKGGCGQNWPPHVTVGLAAHPAAIDNYDFAADVIRCFRRKVNRGAFEIIGNSPTSSRNA